MAKYNTQERSVLSNLKKRLDYVGQMTFDQLIDSDSISWGYSSAADKVSANIKAVEGTNKKAGVATLVAGAVVVLTNQVAANSRFLLTNQKPGGTVGTPYIDAASTVVGTSFKIKSTDAADTSDIYWQIWEPS